jgi:hypothetical protein
MLNRIHLTRLMLVALLAGSAVGFFAKPQPLVAHATSKSTGPGGTHVELHCTIGQDHIMWIDRYPINNPPPECDDNIVRIKVVVQVCGTDPENITAAGWNRNTILGTLTTIDLQPTGFPGFWEGVTDECWDMDDLAQAIPGFPLDWTVWLDDGETSEAEIKGITVDYFCDETCTS